MSKKQTITLATLRSTVRTILIQHGTGLAPTADTPDGIDELIGTVAAVRDRTLSRDSDALLRRVESASDLKVSNAVSDHLGAIMAAYGDAGYITGLAMGLELAAITREKGGAR